MAMQKKCVRDMRRDYFVVLAGTADVETVNWESDSISQATSKRPSVAYPLGKSLKLCWNFGGYS